MAELRGKRAAPDPGRAHSDQLVCAVYLESPRDARAVHDIAKAPSRGEGRARPGLVARAMSGSEITP